jgi:hypothetical protein
MKPIKFKLSTIVKLSLFLALIISFSCQKESSEANAELTIVNTKNMPVAGATVVLSLDGTTLKGAVKPIADSLKITDGAGLVKYQYNYNVIYTATASKIISDSTGSDTLIGIARIKFEEGKTTKETMVIQ